MRNLAFVLSSVFAWVGYAQENLLIENIRVFDGHSVFEHTNVIVESGIVKAIDEGSGSNTHYVRIDGRGKTLLPGFINSHVHAWLPYHLQDAFKAGVFAVLDMHSPKEAGETLRTLRLEDGYAKFYSAGYAATVSGGHGTQYGYEVPVIGPNRSPAQFVEEVKENGSDYVKIIYEPRRRTLALAQVEEIIHHSHEHDLMAVAHISTYSDAKKIVPLHIDGLVHLWKDALLEQDFINELQAQDVFIVPTLSVIEGVLSYYEAEGIKSTISPMDSLLEEVNKLADAGIVILAGTDPPNVLLDYGPSLHNELELFVNAGLTPLEALRTATSNPSKVFNIPYIGTIKAGHPANFILVEGDPTKDIKQTRNIISLWVEGKEIKP